MTPPSLHVRARVTLVPTEAGGRKGPFSDGYRPNHNFDRPGNTRTHIGVVRLSPGDLAYPGQTKEVSITFVNAPGLSQLLVSGRTWRIQEGNRLIATAEVLELVNAS
jgi:translation elongation factor EF-Tu-like GTPase